MGAHEEDAGDQHRRSAEDLLPEVYESLRSLARARMHHEAADHTLQPTMLVHEAYLRLVGKGDPGWPVWNGRGHFFGAAARAMRRILVEGARRKQRLRHGGGERRIELEDAELHIEDHIAAPDDRVLGIDEALTRLEARDERKGRIVELRYFAGFTVKETADAMELSVGTVEREWRFIKAWLQEELAADGG